LVVDIPRLRLPLSDRQTLAEACVRLAVHDIVSQTEEFVIEAQVQAGSLSFDLRRALLEFKRSGHPSGGLLFQGVPVEPLPDTPGSADLSNYPRTR